MQREDHTIIYWLHKALSVDYWNFYGRARRREFWSVILLQAIACTVFATLHFLYFRFEAEFFAALIFYVLAYVYAALTAVPTITVHVRRLHDAGKSGWWHPAGISFISNIVVGSIGIVVLFIYGLIKLLFDNESRPFKSSILDDLTTVISYIVLFIWGLIILGGIIFLFFDSEKGTNRFGENPKANDS
ncbi:DUF805 domain-containing protein [Winogradskyella sp.]|uniref:DUF805 domain-containing protein n=1 Tax=Winogradskyella sp. TaxID=1883156 RepID=UPI0026268EE0|nr:DUF805 domain-containing protein [Winogradskyella sp.]